MGFISRYADKSFTQPGHRAESSGFPGARTGQALWRQVFGNSATSKEDLPKVRNANSGRSAIAGDASVKRLLQAMRSGAPGGWSDDRWEQSKHWEGIQYIGGHRICELLYQAEFQVFEKDDDHPDGKRPVSKRRNPEAYKLVDLLEKPNPQDTFGDLMYRWFQQMTLSGKALTWMVPNVLKKPMELYSIPTAIAIPQAVMNVDYPNGFYRIQPVYPYGPFSSYPTPSTSVGAPIPSEWMLEFKYPHPILRYDGFAPYTALRLHIDELTMIDRSRHYSMRRQIRPMLKLIMKEIEGMEPLPQAEIDRIIAEIENSLMGPENAGALLVPPHGADLEELGTSPREMDYPQSWDQLVGFILGGLGITKPAAGMVEDSSYSTLFATLKQLYWLTIDPACSRFAAGLTRHLAPFFGDNLIVEVRAKRLDDHDIAFTKIDKLNSLKGLPKSVIKEALKLLELPLNQEMIEELSEAGQEQQQGMVPGAEQGGMEEMLAGAGGEEVPEEAQAEPQEVAQERESPEGLSEGALGPRKRLTPYFKKSLGPKRSKQTKSFYERVKEVTCNGH